MIGRTISHYKIVDKLGEGGMGAVYKAEDTTLRRLVALKVLSSHMAEDEEARKRFVREAQAASALNHSNITTVYELLEDEGEQFIVMEYVEGKTIRDMVESGHVSIRKALDIIIQAAEALEAAHNKGILHRDIKSANIMVSMEGNVKVMDFGLAHLEDRSQLTRTGTTMGTLAYSSPEQLTGRQVDSRSEVFSLGCVFYELLTGQLPFKSPSEGELVFEIINEQDRLSKLRDDVPENVEAVVTKMLDKKPELRYQSCSELIGNLNAIRSDLETTTVEISTALPAMRAKKKKQLAIGLGSAAVIIGAAIVLLTGKGGIEIDPNRVVVTVFNNRTQDKSLDPIGEWIASYLTSSIDQADLMNVVPFDHSLYASRVWKERAEKGEISDPIQALAEEIYAGIAVSGDFYLLDEKNLQFHIRIRDINRKEVLEELDPITVPIDEKDEIVDQLRQKVLSVLAVRCNPDFESFAQMVSQPSSFDAFKQYKEGLDTYFNLRGDRPIHYRLAIPYFLRAFEIDNTYIPGLIWAARSSLLHANADVSYYSLADSILVVCDSYREQMTTFEKLQFDAIEAMARGNNLDQHNIMMKIVERFPGTFWTFDAAQNASGAGYPEKALEYFAMIDPNSTAMQQPAYWYNQKCWPHIILEDYQGLLENIYTAREVLGQPNVWDYRETHALAALGRLDEILPIIQARHDAGADGWSQFIWAAVQQKKLKHYSDFNELTNWYEGYLESRPEEEKATRPHRYHLTLLLIMTDRFEEAYPIAKALNTEVPLLYNSTLGIVAARIGDREEAQYQLKRIEERYDEKYQKDAIYRSQANILAHLGEHDEAIRLLGEAVKLRSIWREIYTSGAFLHEPLWDNPQYQQLLRPKG